LQKESSDVITALQAKFLQIQVLVHLTSWPVSSPLTASFLLPWPFAIGKTAADCFFNSTFLLALTGVDLDMSLLQFSKPFSFYSQAWVVLF
jgi:hypothetical protein